MISHQAAYAIISVPFTFAPPLQQPFGPGRSPADAYRTARPSSMSNPSRRRAATSTPPTQAARTSANRNRQQSIDCMNATTASGWPRQPRRPYPTTVPEDDFLPTVSGNSLNDELEANSNSMYVVIFPHQVTTIPVSFCFESSPTRIIVRREPSLLAALRPQDILFKNPYGHSFWTIWKTFISSWNTRFGRKASTIKPSCLDCWSSI
jgi:hypothetical protein